MVNLLRLLIASLSIPLFVWGNDNQINAGMSEYGLVENQPLKGTITVTHNAQIPVDANSFRLEGKPLKAVFDKDVKVSSTSPLTLSIYNFELPAKAKGLYALPEISVKIGGKTYKTIPSSFTVSGENEPAPAAPATANHTNQQTPSSSTEPYLKLEAVVTGGTQPFYPHQRFNFVYKYLYNGNIDLTEEHLPLLTAEGFHKIGDVQVRDEIVDNRNLHEVTQVVEAIKPGQFSFGPSYIQGLPYTEDSLGKKTYAQKKLRSEAPIVNVKVDPFPETGKPPSFNGAIGQYIYKVAMMSPTTVSVGDKVLLNIELTGNPQHIENVPLPEVCCIPGISGLFKMSDLPPASVVRGPTKQFQVELRPLSTQIKEIPNIEFSSFNPETKSYTVQQSDPIPLTVIPQKETSIQPPKETKTEFTTPSKTPQPIEIVGLYPLESSDLQNYSLASWWALLLIPVGAFALYFQLNMRQQQLHQQRQVKEVSSQELFDEALKAPTASSNFYELITGAFLKLLVEHGDIPNANIAPEKLPQTGASGEVRAFLLRIEENRFAGRKADSPSLHQEAYLLFDRLHKETAT